MKQCPQLHHLKFVGCSNFTEDCLRPIGLHARELKTLSFVYESGANWPANVDVLSVLVKNCTCELLTISFIGFPSVTDIGVNYAAECYFGSLVKVNFNYCRNLSDHAINGLANYCKALRDIGFNSTQISDEGLTNLALKCPRLKRVDFGNCPKLTDISVICLANKCTKLEDASMENCLLLTDKSLLAFFKSCLALTSLNFSGTGIHTVPIYVLSVKRLKTLKVSNCEQLITPSPSLLETSGLHGILDYYRDFNVAYR